MDYVVFVRAENYLGLTDQEKYSVARDIGRINTTLKGKNVLLIGLADGELLLLHWGYRFIFPRFAIWQ
jgi:hypothetical protein